MGHGNALSNMKGQQKVAFWEQKLSSEGYGKNPAVTAKYDALFASTDGIPGKNGACAPYTAAKMAASDLSAQGQSNSSPQSVTVTTTNLNMNNNDSCCCNNNMGFNTGSNFQTSFSNFNLNI